MMSIAMALAGEALGTDKRPRDGSARTMSAVGTALGPSLGSARSPVSAGGRCFLSICRWAAGALAWRYLPNGPRAARREPFDRASTLLLGGALLCYSLAMTSWARQLVRSTRVDTGGAVGGALFIGVERRAAHRRWRRRCSAIRPLTAGLAASALVMTVATATLVVGPFYRRARWG
ncbi:hypothetical protein M8494_11375 [Serratia ureilytica]